MAISEEQEIDQVPIEARKVYNMVAEYECCGGRCCTNAGWVWVSVVGADQIHLEGKCASTTLRCKMRSKYQFNQISNDHSKATEQVSNLLESITESLPRLEVYEKLQSDSILQVALLNIFTDVVDFSIRAFQFFRGRTLGVSRR